MEKEEKEILKKIEAILFIAGRFLSITDIVRITSINPLTVKEVLRKLKEKYSKENTALEIIEQNGKFKMDVKPELKQLINKLATGESEFTKAEQSTLALIAYKQPIKQSVVVKIRGNKAYEHIKHFIDSGLVKAKKLGHTLELRLSDKFYDYFSLEKKKDNFTTNKKFNLPHT